jgi:glycosyltransferase involved in cell wall biosynthesis
MTKRLKVLIEAYECSPARGHVPGSAWRIVKGLSRHHDIHVLTEARYEEEIREFVQKTDAPDGRLNFHFIPRVEAKKAKGYHAPLPFRSILRYRKWLKRSYDIASGLNTHTAFDLTHHLRADTFREPGYLWKLGLPFVWGPMGGTGMFPWSMMSILNPRYRAAHTIKNILNTVQLRAGPRVIRAIRSAHIIAQTLEDKHNLLKVHGVESRVVHEQSADPSMGFIRKLAPDNRLELAWAGRCSERKGVPLLFRALQSPDLRGRVVLHFAGTGPKLSEWKQLAHRLGINDAIVWYGWLSQDETVTLLRSCHMTVFPSLWDATSTFVMQSLSTGLPVICLDHCGFGDIIDNTCGFKIPISNPRNVITGIAGALLIVLQNPHLVERLSIGAMEKARKYSWDNTVSDISKVYIEAVNAVPLPVMGSDIAYQPKTPY